MKDLPSNDFLIPTSLRADLASLALASPDAGTINTAVLAGAGFRTAGVEAAAPCDAPPDAWRLAAGLSFSGFRPPSVAGSRDSGLVPGSRTANGPDSPASPGAEACSASFWTRVGTEQAEVVSTTVPTAIKAIRVITPAGYNCPSTSDGDVLMV